MPRMLAEGAVHRSLRTLFEAGALGDLGDGEVIDRYLSADAAQATAAAEQLVDRHGPMVHRICSAILRDPHDAADAFQATFLVLARRARTIRNADSVGPWLFSVARRVSLKSRAASARRRHAELAASARPEAEPVEFPLTDSWEPLLSQLDRLPSRYRDPLILCYLEDLSHEQAAARLGCRLATLRTRLARGKEKLRSRLSRTQMASSALALLEAPRLLTTAPPTACAQACVGLLTATRAQLVPSTIARLASSATPRLFLPTTPSVVTGGLLAAGLMGMTWHTFRGDDPTADPPAPSSSVADPTPVPAPTAELPEPRRSKIAPFLCPTEEPAKILVLLPEGCEVVEGQLVCQIDDSALQGQLADQVSTVARADAASERSRSLETSALRDLMEFEGFRAPAERSIGERRVELSRESLEIARQAERDVAGQEGAPTLSARRAHVDVLTAELHLQEAETGLRVLNQFTLPRLLRDLRTDVERSRTERERAEAELKQARDREAQLRSAIGRTRFLAPRDGVVRYCEPSLGVGDTLDAGAAVLWCEPAPRIPVGPDGQPAADSPL